LVGVKDLIIVETKDALLICKKGRSQDVKKIVDKLDSGKIKKYL
jgi:mannose-1-phosphate guanylyltransferase